MQYSKNLKNNRALLWNEQREDSIAENTVKFKSLCMVGPYHKRFKERSKNLKLNRSIQVGLKIGTAQDIRLRTIN